MQIVRVEVAFPPGKSETVDLLRVAVVPGAWLVESETVPLKPFRLVRLMVLLPQEPCCMLRLLGLADTEKSGPPGPATVTVTVSECDMKPLVPVTVTL